MTSGENSLTQSTSTLHENAVAADEAVYTVQSLLSVCKFASENAENQNVIAADISMCLEHAGKLLLDVGGFIEWVKGLATDGVVDQRGIAL
ncbi:hypothetical protein O206_21975 [Ochrobactrum sp. EGD-AQ16]|nr:hypothetical protein O206_21975 [Ochrobactrum sp. EGD-AQ16]